MPKRLKDCFACVAVCMFVAGPIFAQSIVGTFEFKMGSPGNSMGLQLNCERESRCKLVSTSQFGKGAPSQDVQELEDVRPLDSLVQAERALKYAIEQRTRPIKHVEYAELLSRLSPVLLQNPALEKCWDLNNSSPGYMLACSFSGGARDNSSIYLFATLLAGCGEGFCRYIIYPMSRVK